MSSQIIAEADQRMARAVEAMERDFQGDPDGSGVDRARRADPRRVLRHLDAAQPAGRDQRPGAAPDRHPAVGPRRPGRDREGHHQERHRPDAERRWDRRPAEHPAPHRGTSQGPRAGRPQADGGGPGRDPQRPPRRGRRCSRRRSATARSGRTRSHRQLEILQRTTDRHIAEVDRLGARRNRRSWRSSGSRTARSARRRPASGRAAPTRPRRMPAPTGSTSSEADLPRHVAIIMDGNRRWAREAGQDEAEGHAAGVEAIRPIIRHAVRRGVRALSLFAFSSENWSRSPDEVETLLGLLEAAIRNETPELREQGVQIRLLGRLDELPTATRDVDRRGARGDRRRRAADAQRRLQLCRPARDRRCGAPLPGRRADGRADRRGRHRRAPLHGRACRHSTWSSGPAASTASATS